MLLNISFESLTRSRRQDLTKKDASGAQKHFKKTFQPYMCQIFYSQQLEMKFKAVRPAAAQSCIFSKM